MENAIVRIDFNNPEGEFATIRKELRHISEIIFNELVNPYRHDPEMIRTIAFTRNMLRKNLKDIEPQKMKGGINGKKETS